MIIPPEAQPHVAALVKRNQHLEKRVKEQNALIAELQARVRRQLDAQRDKADKEQRLAARAWREAERLFG